MPITQFIEGQQREVNCFSGRTAITAGVEEPIFEGYTTSGYAREFLLSELTTEERYAAAEVLLIEVTGRTAEQASNVAAAVLHYGDLDGFITKLCRAWRHHS